MEEKRDKKGEANYKVLSVESETNRSRGGTMTQLKGLIIYDVFQILTVNIIQIDFQVSQ